MRTVALSISALTLLFGLASCEVESTSCSDGPTCDLLGDVISICCTDDGTDLNCQYETSDGEVFPCATANSADGLGDSCDEAAADMAQYCLVE